MKVLFLARDFNAPGGIVNYLQTLIAHLPAEFEWTHLPIGRRNYGSKLEACYRPLVDNVKLIRRLLKTQPDCVHVNPSFDRKSLLRDGLFLLTISMFSSAKIFVFFHGWDQSIADAVSARPFLAKLFRFVFKRADTVCVLAAQFKDSLVSLGLEHDRIRLLTTMFHRDFIPQSNSPEAQEFLFMGRVVENKGVFLILQAMQQIARQFPEARLVVAGDGPALEALKHQASALELNGCISFPGYITGSDKKQALANASFFVFPTMHGEGCPVALLEAMAAGLPVITTPMGGISDIFEHETNGYLLPANPSLEALTSAMLLMLKDSDGCLRVGETNRSKAWRLFEAKPVTARMIELYQVTVGTS